MHESALSANLARHIQQVIRQQDAHQVVCVTIDLGEHAGIAAGHLREHLQHELAGTPAGGARIAFVRHGHPADPLAYSARLHSLELVLDDEPEPAASMAD